jgi:VanZ family protein
MLLSPFEFKKMKKWLLFVTVLFPLLIIAIVIGANADAFPRPFKRLIDFPGADKVGHFMLFGILSYLFNKSALSLFPNRMPACLILTVSLFLAIVIGLEEWSQSLFPARTMSLIDLLASYTGVTVFAVLAYRTKK